MKSATPAQANGNQVILAKDSNHLSPPLFILGPPRSFTSLACAMIGQHPQMYGLPEVHLFQFETVGARAEYARGATYPMADGLLRAVAQLFFGAQTPNAVEKAQRWLTARSDLTTDFLFRMLADKVFPRALVDKSPSNVYRREVLERMRHCFPQARFIHLVRHPRGHGKSVMKYIQERAKHGPIPPSHWLLAVSSYPSPNATLDHRPDKPGLDPQNGWYGLHKIIGDFLDTVPAEQRMRVRSEDLLVASDCTLNAIATWLGLRTDYQAIEHMKHPERSRFASLGPPGARYGNDVYFLIDPVLRPARAEFLSLEGPLEWRNDRAEFCTKVKALAREFGYE